MTCVATFVSGNYAYTLCRALERKGYIFEVASTPCRIARGGCGYCLKFPEEFMGLVRGEAASGGTPILEIYKVVPGISKHSYIKVFPV